MAQYINKAALVAEIEKLKGKISDWQYALRMLELSLDTLEVKEVDNVWHNVGEEPDLHSKIMLDNGAVCSVEQWSAKVAETHKWAYVSDLLNLSNVQRTVKNWNESVREEQKEAVKKYRKEDICG